MVNASLKDPALTSAPARDQRFGPSWEAFDMRTVALVTQKGGSGKSTLSASLGVAAQADRETVFLIDMDPQRSLATWAQSRKSGRLGGAAVGPDKLDAVLASLADRGVTLAIIDTPAGLSAVSEAAIQAADLTIIPVRPTAFDLWSGEATWRHISALGRDGVFVLNQCPIMQTSRRLHDTVSALEVMGGLLRPIITTRVDYQDAILRGLGPTEIDADGPAAREVWHLWRSLQRRFVRLASDRSLTALAA